MLVYVVCFKIFQFLAGNILNTKEAPRLHLLYMLCNTLELRSAVCSSVHWVEKGSPALPAPICEEECCPLVLHSSCMFLSKGATSLQPSHHSLLWAQLYSQQQRKHHCRHPATIITCTDLG